MKRLILLLGALLCFGLAGGVLLWAGLPQRADYTGFTLASGLRVAPELNSHAPPFTLMTLRGEEIALDALRGGPVVVNFWATWCAPCRVEMPELQKLYEVHQGAGLRILALNLDEPPGRIQTWVDEMRLSYDILLDIDQSTAQAYRIFAQPSTFVINPAGRIVRIFYGPVTMTQLEAVLAPYLS